MLHVHVAHFLVLLTWYSGSRLLVPMYDEATARKILQEAVLVSAERAVDGEAVVGFNPNDATLDNFYLIDNKEITPMIYFALRGDAKMCRYLISRGASTTKRSERNIFFYPMYVAANGGHLDLCKVLYANGAQIDVRRDYDCLLYTSPSPRDRQKSRMPSSA